MHARKSLKELQEMSKDDFDRHLKEQEYLRKPREDWFKWAQLVISGIGLLSLVIGLCSFFVALGSVILALSSNSAASEKQAANLRSSVHQSTSATVIAIDKIFCDKPELYKYFYDGVEPTDWNDPQLLAVAQAVTDCLDLLVTQVTENGGLWSKPDLWDNFIVDMFRWSPILRRYFRDHQTWYGPQLKARLLLAEDDLPKEPRRK